MAEVFNYIEQHKGKLLLETMTENPLPETLANNEKEITQEIQEVQQKISLATTDSVAFYQKQLFDANQKMEKLIKIIKTDYPDLATCFYNEDYIDPTEIQNIIEEETLFVSYSFTANQVIIYKIDKNGQKVIEISPKDNLHEDIKRLTQLLESPFLIQEKNRKKFIMVSNRLYKTLIKPLSASLEGKSKLMVVLSGELFYIPFEVLLATKETKAFKELNFLIKDFEINYHYSTTAFHRLQQKTKIIDKSLLAFAPVFENGISINRANRAFDFIIDSLYRSIENNRFVALPNTAKEVKTISEITTSKGGKSTVLLKKAANKKRHIDSITTTTSICTYCDTWFSEL